MLENEEWSCQSCGDLRENARISVRTVTVYLAGVPVDMNIRYCNDRPACWAGTEDFYQRNLDKPNFHDLQEQKE